jgi:thymidylate synthase
MRTSPTWGCEGSVESVTAMRTESPERLNVTKPFNIASYALFDYAFEDFEILDYHSHAAIKAPIAV